MRVPCTECENLILPATAERNGGLCAQCVKLSAEARQAGRDFDTAVKSGELWVPSESELSSAQTPAALRDATWSLEPDYYAGQPELTVEKVVLQACEGGTDDVFLYSAPERRLLVCLNYNYGVCEYQDRERDDWRYAYSVENLASQVPENLHIGQPCACCGAGLGWYPSRFHMPREQALSILKSVVDPSTPPAVQVQWLELGDISRYGPGKG